LGSASVRRRFGSSLIQKAFATLLSIDSLKGPALLAAPTLQLALNLFDFRSIAGTDSDFSGEDMYSMSMSVSVGIFISSPSMANSPWSNMRSHFRIRNLAARGDQL
jgi:hypothetical protein